MAKFMYLFRSNPGAYRSMSPEQMQQTMKNHRGRMEVGEMILPSERGNAIPSGSYVKWICL